MKIANTSTQSDSGACQEIGRRRRSRLTIPTTIATIPAIERDEPNTELVRHVCQQLLSDADYQLITRVLGIGCQPVLIRIIAKEMGITHQATLNRYRAALCRLRQRLENRPNLMKELFEA